MSHSTSRRLFLAKSALATTGLALLSSNTLTAFSTDTPFEGYNSFAEEKTDLRTELLGKEAKVSGKIFSKEGLLPIAGALIEVWHLSPNSKKFRHRAKFRTNQFGEYSFVTDFPEQDGNLCPRIYFKVSNNEKSTFSELLINKQGSFITSKHWEQHSQLGNRLEPEFSKAFNRLNVTFNLSL